MRQHTAFRVGRTTRCLDFRAALSVITTITDLIPGQRLFVFNGTSARRAPPAVPPGLPARAPEPLCVPELIFLGPGTQVAPGCLSWPLRAFHAAAWPVAGPPSRPGGSERRPGLARARRTGNPGAPDDATPRADTLVCVGPRAFRPQGAGPFGGARAIGAVEARLVHTEEAAGSNPASPTSSGPGVRPGRTVFQAGPIRFADGVFPCRARFSARCGPRPGRRLRRRRPSSAAAPQGNSPHVPARSSSSAALSLELGVRRVRDVFSGQRL